MRHFATTAKRAEKTLTIAIFCVLGGIAIGSAPALALAPRAAVTAAATTAPPATKPAASAPATTSTGSTTPAARPRVSLQTVIAAVLLVLLASFWMVTRNRKHSRPTGDATVD